MLCRSRGPAAGTARCARRGSASRRSCEAPASGVEQAVRAWLPAEHPLGLRQVGFRLSLVAGDEERVEAAVADLDPLERRQVRAGEILLIGNGQRAPGLVDDRVPPLRQVLLAGARGGDPQCDEVHAPPAGEVLADLLAEAL